MATRLTSGRLRQSQRNFMKQVYAQEENKNLALKLAQQIAILSPEYATTSIVREMKNERSQLPPATKSCNRYKAVVHILLKGGCDSFNLLVPHSQCKEKGASFFSLIETCINSCSTHLLQLY